jgi:shikimate kinase
MHSLAFGGISVVNAIPCYLGSTMAVDLKVEVEVGRGEGTDVQSELVKTILDYFWNNYGEKFYVTITSELPQRGGLKSSSAVAVAIIHAISKLLGLETDVPVLAAKLNLKAGVSVTGALDDAAAAYLGGISFTDNANFKVLKVEDPPREIVVVILPIGERPVKDLSPLRSHSLLFEQIFSLAYSGRVLEAMKMNGIAVAELLGYDVRPIREALKAGALAAGVSGNGPSIFAACKQGEEGPVVDRLSTFGKVVVTRPVGVVDRGKAL